MMDALAVMRDHPLAGIGLTVAAYAASVAMWRRSGEPALVHPILTATVTVAVVLAVAGVSYPRYVALAWPIHEGLGVIVVLLAVPLYRQSGRIARSWRFLAPSLLVGSVAALVFALVLPAAVGAAPDLIATLAPKSATTAVAVALSEQSGGIVGITAVVVIASGLWGAIFGPAILHRVGVDDDRAVGFALGVASHALGTARALQISETAGAFASLGMILNALLTIGLVPLALSILI